MAQMTERIRSTISSAHDRGARLEDVVEGQCAIAEKRDEQAAQDALPGHVDADAADRALEHARFPEQPDHGADQHRRPVLDEAQDGEVAGAQRQDRVVGGPSATSVPRATDRSSSTRRRISSYAGHETTLSVASASAPPPVSTRTSTTPNSRCIAFCTASRFWIREYGTWRSFLKNRPDRITSSPSPNV